MKLKSCAAAVAIFWVALGIACEAPSFAESEKSSVIYAPEFGMSVPQPLHVGLEARTDTKVRYFFSTGYFKYPLSTSDHQFSIFSVEAGARYYPHYYGLYAGLGLGYRKIGVSTNVSAFQIEGATVASGATLDLSTVYLAPSIGINFQLSRRLFIGFDAGVQYALYASGKLTMHNDGTATDPNDLQTDNGVAMNRVAGLLLPEITLFRLSWILD